MSSPVLITPPEGITWSDRFNDEGADVTFISSDGVRFRIHSVFLKAHTEALAPEHGSSLDDPAPLTESSAILELLFGFIYPDGEPTVKLEVDFNVLLELAEAAAKYQVFPALYVCTKQLKTVLPNHAVEILAYAYKHGCYGLINEAAICAMNIPPLEVLEGLPGELFKAWLGYRHKWETAQRNALTEYLPSDQESLAIVRRIGDKLSSLADLNITFGEAQTPWRASVERDVTEIPTFTDLIGWKEDEGSTPRSINGGQPDRVIIETADGTDQYIALEMLRACTSSFGEPVNGRLKVAEKSTTIELLLRFIKPVQSPELGNLEFSELKDLALAAEKYCVRQARGFCRVLMKDAVQNHPHDVFHYAAEAHYLDILDLTAPLILGPLNSFEGAIKRLPPRLVSAWVLYYQRWQEAVKLFLEAVRAEGENVSRIIGNYRVYGHCNCRYDYTFNRLHVSPIFSRLIEEPGVLRDLDSILTQQSLCSQAQQVFDKCKVVAKDAINAIPPLSSFV